MDVESLLWDIDDNLNARTPFKTGKSLGIVLLQIVIENKPSISCSFFSLEYAVVKHRWWYV